MIRVAIVEDRQEISAGLTYIISNQPGFTCKSFSTGEAAVGQVSPAEFDVVLMDIELPGISGIECTHILHQKYPTLKIMMCTIFQDEDKIYRAIAAGASGYILKRTEPELLIKSIKDLLDGGAPISSIIASKVLTAFRKLMPSEMNSSTLSEREQEVLSLLAMGYRNKQVAEKLNISIATVKSHIYNCYQKLHVTSKVEAINKFKSQSRN
jgi:DNA-binding NarL/FixJ family response regulator